LKICNAHTYYWVNTSQFLCFSLFIFWVHCWIQSFKVRHNHNKKQQSSRKISYLGIKNSLCMIPFLSLVVPCGRLSSFTSKLWQCHHHSSRMGICCCVDDPFRLTARMAYGHTDLCGDGLA